MRLYSVGWPLFTTGFVSNVSRYCTLPQTLQLKYALCTLVKYLRLCEMCNEIPTCTDSTASHRRHHGFDDRRDPVSSSHSWCRWSGGRGQAWSPDTLLRLICSSAPTARVCLVLGAIKLLSMLFIMMMMHQSNNVIMMMITIPVVSDC